MSVPVTSAVAAVTLDRDSVAVPSLVVALVTLFGPAGPTAPKVTGATTDIGAVVTGAVIDTVAMVTGAVISVLIVCYLVTSSTTVITPL